MIHLLVLRHTQAYPNAYYYLYLSLGKQVKDVPYQQEKKLQNFLNFE